MQAVGPAGFGSGKVEEADGLMDADSLVPEQQRSAVTDKRSSTNNVLSDVNLLLAAGAYSRLGLFPLCP